MFQAVVVGADDSPTAAKAVSEAIQIVKMSGGVLHIVTAYKPKPVGNEADLPDEFRYAMTSTTESDDLLRKLANEATAEGVRSETHAATDDPSEALITIAEREGCDLIVVGNKGMKGARRMLGSVPNTVAHKAGCAVLIVPTT